MTVRLRLRILLTLVPLLLLLAVVGTAGVILLSRLGNSVNAILRENYDSVIAMERLNEALERIDSSFQFALSGRQREAREQYQKSWQAYDDSLRAEQHNVTLEGEDRLVQELVRLTGQYRRQGEEFHRRPAGDGGASDLYYRPENGLLAIFNQVKAVSGGILHLNQNNMEQASRDARRLAVESLVWFGI